MKRPFRALILMLAATALALLPACAAATPATPTIDPNMIYTQAVMTVEAGLTQTAAAQPTNTATPEPTETPQPSPTLPPPPTPTAISETKPAALPTATSQAPGATSPAVNQPGDHAAWQSQSPRDGSAFAMGDQFNLMFSLLNTGTTTWTSGYRMTWVGGTELAAAHTFTLTKDVKPGEKGEFYFASFAPYKSGSHKSVFYLYNAAGVSFYEVYFTFKVN